MDIFTQKKTLIRIIILLIALNLISLGVFLWKDFFNKPPRPDRPKENREVATVLKKELNLTEKQFEQVNDLRSVFSEKEKVLEATIKEARDSMNIIMFNKNTDEARIKSLASKIANNEYKMEMLRFDQAKQLKTICNDQQLEKFEGLVLEIRDFFKPDNPPKKEK